MKLQPPRLVEAITSHEQKLLFDATKRIEADLRNVRRYGLYGAILGALVGLAISGDQIPRKMERTAHNIMLGAGLGALIFGYVST